MAAETNIDKLMVAKAVVTKVKSDSEPDEIKAKYISEYELPGKISVKGKDNGHIPDIAVEYKDGTDVYEIELDNNIETEKWKLFSLYTKKKNGKFFVVVPDFLKQEVKDKLLENEINANLIYFPTN